MPKRLDRVSIFSPNHCLFDWISLEVSQVVNCFLWVLSNSFSFSNCFKLRNILDIFISWRFSISFWSLLPYLYRIICVALGVIYVNSCKALYRQFLWLFLGSVIENIMFFPVVQYNRFCVSLNQDLFPQYNFLCSVYRNNSVRVSAIAKSIH